MVIRQIRPVPWSQGTGMLRAAFPSCSGRLRGLLAGALLPAMRTALDSRNSAHEAPGRIRLRMAMHVGEVSYDKQGITAVGAPDPLWPTFRCASGPDPSGRYTENGNDGTSSHRDSRGQLAA